MVRKTISASDLLALRRGQKVLKSELYDAIVRSKVGAERSKAALRERIGNTPQQGIHWIGEFPNIRGAIVKIIHGAYEADIASGDESLIRYSLKLQKGSLLRAEKANQALLLQPAAAYPVIVLIEEGDSYRCAGKYGVRADSWSTSVELVRQSGSSSRRP